MAWLRIAATSAFAVALAACSTPEPTPPPKKAKIAKRDWVGDIRAQAKAVASAVTVEPLASPELADLRQRASEEEARGDYAAAAATLARAVALNPDDPSLPQWQAELALAQAQYAEAESLALRSYDMGPKLGEICVRNWLTIKAARVERKQTANAESAQAQVAACQIAPPVRM